MSMSQDTPTPLQPSTLIIFGITGDLAHRKLLPALYELSQHELLPEAFRIVGVTRNGISHTRLLQSIQDSMTQAGQKCEPNILAKLDSMIEIVTMDLLDPTEYVRLRKHLDAIEDRMKMCMNRLFYLAIPAQTFGPVVEQLGANGLNTTCQHATGASRLLIEKPFGYDLASARELIENLTRHYHEEQIYRIDHYLAKETAQNILNFRFQNPIFSRNWDHHSISHIMITAAEELGIEGRVAFYEQTGALRDFVQSHLLQLLALVTMEKPAKLTSAEIHRQKLALLQSITPIAANMVSKRTVRGQYDTYRAEVSQDDSITETYAALCLEINNQRWRNVPILLRTGKALAEKCAEINIVFSDSDDLTEENVLTIRIQPNEGISLRLLAKKPGLSNDVEPVNMDFCYRNLSTDQSGPPDAYQRVLMDAFRGDKTLFATRDEVIASWQILENVIHEWSKNDAELHIYRSGSWGPAAADELAQRAGAAWLAPDLQTCLVSPRPS